MVEVTSFNQLDDDGNVKPRFKKFDPENPKFFHLTEGGKITKQIEGEEAKEYLKEITADTSRRKKEIEVEYEAHQMKIDLRAPYLNDGKETQCLDDNGNTFATIRRIGKLCEFKTPDSEWLQIRPSFEAPNESSLTTLRRVIGNQDLADRLLVIANKRKPKISDIADWSHVLEYNVRGDPVGLIYGKIAKLLAPNYYRIDTLLVKAQNNIAVPAEKDDIVRDVLCNLRPYNLEDYWTTKSYSLTYDHLQSQVPLRKLGHTVGRLPLLNGVFDFQEGGLVETDELYLQKAATSFDPNATECPRIDKLLSNAFLPEQLKLVYSILGAGLTGAKAQYILALTGRGRNGKSQLREILGKLCGDLWTTEKLEGLHTLFVNEAFAGRKFLWETEVSPSRDFVTQLKDATGGTDIVIRRKYQNGSALARVQLVAILDTNSPPEFEDSTSINDRLRYIDMPKHFVYEYSGAANEILIDSRLANLDGIESELPAWFNKLVPYGQYFLEHGKLQYDIKDTHKSYKEKAEALMTFFSECCIEEGQMDIRTLAKYYDIYAAQQNTGSLTVSTLRHKLKKEFGLVVRVNKVYGLSLRRDSKLVQDIDGRFAK